LLRYVGHCLAHVCVRKSLVLDTLYSSIEAVVRLAAFVCEVIGVGPPKTVERDVPATASGKNVHGVQGSDSFKIDGEYPTLRIY